MGGLVFIPLSRPWADLKCVEPGWAYCYPMQHSQGAKGSLTTHQATRSNGTKRVPCSSPSFQT